MAKDPRKILAALAMAVSLIFFFYGLGRNSLIEFDEGIYALVAKRIVQSGDFLILTWKEGVPWFDKGPLYFWLTAPLLKVFGFKTLAVRFWSALFGFLTVFCVYLIGKVLVDAYLGIIASVILTSTIGFLYYGRMGMLDVPNAFFNTVAVLFLILSQRKKKFLYPAAVAFALGFLNRGFLVFTGLSSFLLFSLIFNRSFFRFKKEEALSVLIFLLITLPWHIFMVLRFGTGFIQTYFVHQMFSRFTQTIEGKGAPSFWYLTVIRTHFRIWFAAIILQAPLFLLRLSKRDRILCMLSIWTVVVFFVFTLSQSKLIWYIMPVYPPLALTVAYGFYHLVSIRPKTLPVFTLGLLIIGSIYVFRLWGRVVTQDFNRDFVKVVEAFGGRFRDGDLVVVNFGYSVASFYTSATVKEIPLDEFPGMLTEGYPVVISSSDLNKKMVSHQVLYKSGDVLLIKKLND